MTASWSSSSHGLTVGSRARRRSQSPVARLSWRASRMNCHASCWWWVSVRGSERAGNGAVREVRCPTTGPPPSRRPGSAGRPGAHRPRRGRGWRYAASAARFRPWIPAPVRCRRVPLARPGSCRAAAARCAIVPRRHRASDQGLSRERHRVPKNALVVCAVAACMRATAGSSASRLMVSGRNYGWPGRGQRPAQFAGIGGDNRVRSEALMPPARNISGPARKLLPPDPVRRELMPQHGQLVAHRRHLHAFVRSRNLGCGGQIPARGHQVSAHQPRGDRRNSDTPARDD